MSVALVDIKNWLYFPDKNFQLDLASLRRLSFFFFILVEKYYDHTFLF